MKEKHTTTTRRNDFSNNRQLNFNWWISIPEQNGEKRSEISPLLWTMMWCLASGEKKNWNKLVLNYPNQTLAIAEKLRTDNVQLMVQSKKWWWIQNLQWRAIQYQSSTDLSIFCLLQISVPTNGDDAMSDMENFSTTSSIISQIENGPDKLINDKRLLCNQILGFFSSVDENRTKDEPIDFAMDTTWGNELQWNAIG